MKKSFIIHPFLLAIYPVVFLFSHNIGQVSFDELIKPILIILFFALTAWCILNILLQDWQRSGIIVSLFLFLFFFYGHVRNYLETLPSVLLISLFWVLLFILGSFFIVVTKKPFSKTTMILNAVSVILVTISATNIIFHQLTAVRKYEQNASIKHIQSDSKQGRQTGTYPDIYFIILDAYARGDVLKDFYDFDNSEFLNYLESKGFYIADRAASNYGQTGLFVASCFNLTYLDNFAKYVGQYNVSRVPLEGIISESFAMRYLKKRGYTIVSFTAERAETEFANADIYLKSGISIDTFYNALKNTTPIPDIMNIMSSMKVNNDFDKYRGNILYGLDTLKEVAKLRQTPKFIFAHIESPHPPFVFGPNGKPINLESRLNDNDGDWLIRRGRLSLEEYRKHYRNQVVFINRQTKEIVDEILANSKQPPIILLLADHGPRSKTIWEDPSRTNMREHLSTLSAFYMPNRGDILLYPEITPVNIFRVIFNHYFGENLDLLPDKNFFSTAKYLYKFYDVTDRIKSD
jgi:hypothetical protein